MKKTYINPSLEVVKIQTIGMLANSLTKDNETKIGNNSDVLGRSFDFTEE